MNCIQSDLSDAFGNDSDMDLDQNGFSEVQLKTSKAFVVQSLHPSITTSDISVGAQPLGIGTQICFRVRNVNNMFYTERLKTITTGIFHRSQSCGNYNKFYLKNVFHTKISIKKPYKQREFIQCINCQYYAAIQKANCVHSKICQLRRISFEYF